MNCSQDKCESPATVRIFWPGKVPPPVYCDEHAAKARRVLEALGVLGAEQPVPPPPMPDDEFNQSCEFLVIALRGMDQEHRERFFRLLAENFCLACGWERTGDRTCHCTNDE